MRFSRPAFQRLALATLAACLVALAATRLVRADHPVDAHAAHPPASHAPSTPAAGDALQPVSAPLAPGALDAPKAAGDVLYDQSFPLRAGDRLVIALSSEDVVVVPGSSAGATVTVNGTGRDARAEFQRRRFAATYENGRLQVRTDPERRSNGRNVQASFTVTVRVPERLSAEIGVASGDVRLDRLVGPLSLSAASGDVQIGTVQGPSISVEAASGDVSAEALDGTTSLRTASGDIEVGRIIGDAVEVSTASGDVALGLVETNRFEASTASGNVEVDRLVGPAEVSTASGDVSMHLDGAATVSTGSGSVRLGLPRGAGFDVDLQSGDIAVADALGFSGATGRRSMEGRIGGGGAHLSVSTGSGSIVLQTGR